MYVHEEVWFTGFYPDLFLTLFVCFFGGKISWQEDKLQQTILFFLNWLFAKPVMVSSFKGTTSHMKLVKACFVKEGFSVTNSRDQSTVSVRPS